MKKLYRLIALFCLAAAMTVPASAMTFRFDAPGSPEYGRSTSVEPVVTADRGERTSMDVSKNAALVPPGFGTASADTLNTGLPLTPNLAPGYQVGAGASVSGGASVTVTQPPSLSASLPGGSLVVPGSSTLTVTAPDSTAINTPTSAPTIGFTTVTADLYYSGGYLATLKIPSLKVNGKVYEGTGNSTLKKGVGHFEDTSIWDGNCALAAHNRGANNYFGQIHTLNLGDKITLTTKLGTRTYAVTSVSKVSETDRSGLVPSGSNVLTLYTCVRDERDLRWCVTAAEVV